LSSAMSRFRRRSVREADTPLGYLKIPAGK
jgi:hypothetical protein